MKGSVVLKLGNDTFWDKGFGLQIFLFVGFLTLLLVVTSNAALTAQSLLSLWFSTQFSPTLWFFFFFSQHTLPFLPCLSSPSFFFRPLFYLSSLLSYNLSSVEVQIITFSSIPMQFHFRLESQGKVISSKGYLETCFRRQIAFGSELPKCTNSTREAT